MLHVTRPIKTSKCHPTIDRHESTVKMHTEGVGHKAQGEQCAVIMCTAWLPEAGRYASAPKQNKCNK
eukprot:6488840-Amphidinium_carterae.1